MMISDPALDVKNTRIQHKIIRDGDGRRRGVSYRLELSLCLHHLLTWELKCWTYDQRKRSLVKWRQKVEYICFHLKHMIWCIRRVMVIKHVWSNNNSVWLTAADSVTFVRQAKPGAERYIRFDVKIKGGKLTELLLEWGLNAVVSEHSHTCGSSCDLSMHTGFPLPVIKLQTVWIVNIDHIWSTISNLHIQNNSFIVLVSKCI